MGIVDENKILIQNSFTSVDYNTIDIILFSKVLKFVRILS